MDLNWLKSTMLFPALLAVHSEAQAEKPNILLVVSDDQSAFAVGSYGNPDIKTPNLDRFASEGVQFNRAYCASPQSVPSRASIFTGRSPVAVRMTRFNVPLQRRYKTFPEYLRENGYYTGVAGRGYHMDGSVSGKVGRIREADEYYEAKGLKTFRDRLDTVMIVPDCRKHHEKINLQFIDFMNSRDKSKPFFLQLGYSDPHIPYDAPVVHDPAKLRLPSYYPDTEGLRKHLGAYYDECYRLDSDFGELMKYLDDNNLTDNTVVIFIGDNGGAQLRGKGTLYEDGVRIPFIIRWPGHIQPGMKSQSVISTVDIASTLLSIAGIEVPQEMEGVNLMDVLAQKEDADRYVYSVRCCHSTNDLPWTSAQYDQQRTLIGPRYKLVYNLLPNVMFNPVDFAKYPFWEKVTEMYRQGTLDSKFVDLYFSPVRPMFELFDLENDPTESVNLIDTPELKELQDKLILMMTYKMIDDEDYSTLPLPKKYDAKY